MAFSDEMLKLLGEIGEAAELFGRVLNLPFYCIPNDCRGSLDLIVVN
jgi:hypothetical protein